MHDTLGALAPPSLDHTRGLSAGDPTLVAGLSGLIPIERQVLCP